MLENIKDWYSHSLKPRIDNVRNFIDNTTNNRFSDTLRFFLEGLYPEDARREIECKEERIDDLENRLTEKEDILKRKEEEGKELRRNLKEQLNREKRRYEIKAENSKKEAERSQMSADIEKLSSKILQSRTVAKNHFYSIIWVQEREDGNHRVYMGNINRIARSYLKRINMDLFDEEGNAKPPIKGKLIQAAKRLDRQEFTNGSEEINIDAEENPFYLSHFGKLPRKKDYSLAERRVEEGNPYKLENGTIKG